MTQKSSWSFSVGKIAGIPVKIHATLILFLIWIGITDSGNLKDAILEVAFVASIFFCILLHELSHSLTARIFSIKTRDIVLYPFGGIATILSDAKPLPELLIAAAGPLSNFIIAALLSPLVHFLEIPGEVSPDLIFQNASIWDRIFITNITIGVFNLIPAFPMDGGRILRAFLALIIGSDRATVISARIGQIVSILLAGFALYTGNPILVIISMLIFSSASQERFQVKSKQAVVGHLASEVMIPFDKVQTIPHGALLSQAVSIVVKSLQNHFPIVFGDDVIGFVHKNSILTAAAMGEADHYIGELVNRDFIKLKPTDLLNLVVEKMSTRRDEPIIVSDNGRILGMITPETVMEFLVVSGLPEMHPKLAQ